MHTWSLWLQGPLQIGLHTVRQREESAAPWLTSNPKPRTNKWSMVNYYSHCIFYILKVVTSVRYMSLVVHWFGCVKYWIFVIFRQAQLKKIKTNIQHVQIDELPRTLCKIAKIFSTAKNGPVPRQFKTHELFKVSYTVVIR